MPMDQRYRWRFTAPGERLEVHMRNSEGGEDVFTAGMSLTGEPVSSASLARAIARHPLMTVKVIGAIYLQALRLWRKRIPFHEHPATRQEIAR